MKGFKNALLRELADRLTAAGFEQKKAGLFVLPIRDGWHGWLGLNEANYPKSFEINPVVGVRSDMLEQALRDLMQSKATDYAPASLSTTLRALSDTPLERWSFDGAVEPPTQFSKVADLVETLMTIGVPFMRSRCSLEALRKALSPGEPDNFQTEYRYPVLLALLGEANVAIGIVERYVASFPEAYVAGSYYDNYKAFAERFRQYIADHPVVPPPSMRSWAKGTTP